METHKLRSEMQVNSMLRCSIISLCKTMVPYDSQISIQGIIGITIDNSDVLLIDVHDTIGELTSEYLGVKPLKDGRVKSERVERSGAESVALPVRDIKSEATQRTEGYPIASYEAPPPACVNLDETPEEDYNDDGNDYNYDGYDEDGYANNDSTRAYGGGEECDDATDASTTDYQYDVDEPGDNMDHIVSQSLASGLLVQHPKFNSTKHHTNDNSVAHYSNENSNAQYSSENTAAYDSNHLRRASKSSVGRRVRPYPKNRTFEPAASSSQDSQRKVKGGRTSLLPDEVGTMYTCSICGQIIKHLGSFMRHKQKHEGIMYRCEDCGKCYSRKDNFNVHRKKCLMFRSLGGDQSDIM